MQYYEIKKNIRTERNLSYVQLAVFVIFCVAYLFVPLVRFTWSDEILKDTEYFVEFSVFQKESKVNIVDEDNKFDLGYKIEGLEKLFDPKSFEDFQEIEEIEGIEGEKYGVEKSKTLGNWLFYGIFGILPIGAIITVAVVGVGLGTKTKTKYKLDVKNVNELSKNDFRLFLFNEFDLSPGIGTMFFGIFAFTVPVFTTLWPYKEKMHILLPEGVEYVMTPSLAIFVLVFFVVTLIIKMIQSSYEKKIGDAIRENNILSLDMLNGKVPSTNDQAQAATSTANVAPQPSAPANKANAIREYKQLLDEGAITQEEYDKLKDTILSKE